MFGCGILEFYELFNLACDVGWLNVVDRDERTDEEVYAFFHANFQEYFAALAINNWDYFLPREHDNKPVVDKRYRIFEPQWKEVILLWLGRKKKDVPDADKEEFIKKLVDFNDGCGNHNFYYRAYFLAAAGIAEFKCDLTDKIVKQIVEWGFGKFNSETQKWEKFVREVEKSAEEVLQETNRENAMNGLVDLIRQPDVDDNTKYSAALSLGQIDPGNENAISALVDLIHEPDVDDDTKYSAALSLREILTDKHIPIVFKALKADLSLETSNHNSALLNYHYQIIWQCAQNMTYPEFYQAWHGGVVSG